MSSLSPRVSAVIVMDADGRRLVAKYYGEDKNSRFMAGKEEEFETKLFKKTRNNATAVVDADARNRGRECLPGGGGRRGGGRDSRGAPPIVRRFEVRARSRRPPLVRRSSWTGAR